MLSAAPDVVMRWWAAAEAYLAADDPDEVAGPPVSAREAARILRRPAVVGLLASIAITFGASQQSSVFSLKVSGAWYFGIPSITTPPGRGLLLSLVACYGGMFMLVRAWLEICQTIRHRRGMPVWPIVVVFALWVVPLLVGPPLFSRDVYSYAAQGDMVTQGINPYKHGPYALGPLNPYGVQGGRGTVDTRWGNAPAPYGPFFIELAAWSVNLTGHHPLATVELIRLLELAGVLLVVFFIPGLARSTGRDPSLALALAVLNPLVLIHLIAGAHNDALMIGLLVAGLAMARRGRPVVGVLLCALGAAVKVPAAIGVVYIGWQWLGPEASWRARLRPLVTSVAMCFAVFALLSSATGLGWGWLNGLGNPGSLRSIIDPPTALGMLFGTVTHGVGLGVGVTTMITVMRTLGELVALGVGATLLLRSDRVGWVRALGAGLLLVVLLGPVIQPWYLAWPVVLLALAPSGRIRKVLVVVSVIGSFIGFPGGSELLGELGRSSLWSVALAVAVLVGILAPPFVRWARALVAPAFGRLGPASGTTVGLD